jgi:hypothetical protein
VTPGHFNAYIITLTAPTDHHKNHDYTFTKTAEKTAVKDWTCPTVQKLIFA